MDLKLEEQFIAYVDFLGARSAIKSDKEAPKLLHLLTDLAALRGEFSLEIRRGTNDGSSQIKCAPAVTTFSDNIVVSYSLDQLRAQESIDESVISGVIKSGAERIIGMIAAEALRLGFLIRGGATIGPLYHRGGVVFGPAMVEAYEIEQRTAVYPRVVLSRTVIERHWWGRGDMSLCIGEDGLAQLNVLHGMLFRPSLPGGWDSFQKDWFEEVCKIIQGRMDSFAASKSLSQYSKWAWFAQDLRRTLEVRMPGIAKTVGINLDAIPRPDARFP